jgi:DNA polymerase-1
MPTKEFNVRRVFGPPTGYEWWEYDYDNVEMRIWAYSVGNPELISCFERGESVHLMMMELIHGYARKECDDYHTTKNGDFSVIYGGTRETVDTTYGVEGAYYKVIDRFPEVKPFTDRINRLTKKCGYVETLGGYRLYVPPDEPHKACNYFVQGSAAWVMTLGMINCWELLRGEPIRMFLQVHDDLKFESPVDLGYPKTWRRRIKRALESPGDEFGIPLPVECKVTRTNWDEAEVCQI